MPQVRAADGQTGKKFSELTDQMIQPQLFVDTTDDLETTIKNFQASLQTALKFESTPTDKVKQNNKSHTDDFLLDLIHHKRKFLRLYRQYGSPCYKTLLTNTLLG